MWNRATQAISEASLILFIGYSMPASDGFMKSLFQSALTLRNGKPPEVYVIDLCADDNLKNRYEETFPFLKNLPGKMPRFQSKSFSDAWKDNVIKDILANGLH